MRSTIQGTSFVILVVPSVNTFCLSSTRLGKSSSLLVFLIATTDIKMPLFPALLTKLCIESFWVAFLAKVNTINALDNGVLVLPSASKVISAVSYSLANCTSELSLKSFMMLATPFKRLLESLKSWNPNWRWTSFPYVIKATRTLSGDIWKDLIMCCMKVNCSSNSLWEWRDSTAKTIWAGLEQTVERNGILILFMQK